MGNYSRVLKPKTILIRLMQQKVRRGTGGHYFGNQTAIKPHTGWWQRDMGRGKWEWRKIKSEDGEHLEINWETGNKRPPQIHNFPAAEFSGHYILKMHSWALPRLVEWGSWAQEASPQLTPVHVKSWGPPSITVKAHSTQCLGPTAHLFNGIKVNSFWPEWISMSWQSKFRGRLAGVWVLKASRFKEQTRVKHSILT